MVKRWWKGESITAFCGVKFGRERVFVDNRFCTEPLVPYRLVVSELRLVPVVCSVDVLFVLALTGWRSLVLALSHFGSIEIHGGW